MGCNHSNFVDSKIPLLSKSIAIIKHDNNEDTDEDRFFNKYFKNIPLSDLRISEEFIHDGHAILNNARILERFTLSCKKISNCEDKIKFIEIGQNKFCRKIKHNFQEHADIYHISIQQCIILWQDKFIKYFPEFGHNFITKIKNECAIQEWNTILWNDYSKDIS